jgi:DNA-binding LacI/PurR family transcriptional regulator
VNIKYKFYISLNEVIDINIYDVAKVAGVSTATVSRVVNNNGNVSLKTHIKVEAVMQELNYQPNAFARGLMTNSIRTIGVLVSDIRDSYYSTVTYSIEQTLMQNGYSVILCNTGNDLDSKKKYINMLLSKGIDSLILVGSVFKDRNLTKLIVNTSLKIPVFLVNSFIDGENIYCVLCDDKLGVELAVNHLKSIGKDKIVFLKDANTYSATRKASGASGYHVIEVGKGMMGGYNGAKDLREKNIEVNGIISCEDITSIGAMKYFRNIGKDVAIVGFNNSVMSLATTPELTTIDSGMDQIGVIASEKLIDVIENKFVAKKTIIKPKLIIRESTVDYGIYEFNC